jgi:diacylglycerol kinase (ATP)
MIASNMKKILFIINPISGTGRNKTVEKIIGETLDQSQFSGRIVYTEFPGQATELCRTAVSEGFDVVAAVGGDGTVNEVGQALVGTDTALAIIPTGSGNGLARHLKIPRDPVKSVRLINAYHVRRIDTASINDKVFLSIAGIGYDAFVAKKFAKASRRGFFSYFRIVSGEYPGYRPKKYTLEVDGKTIKRRALLIAFANSSQFGNNTSIYSKAAIDDGYVDLCILRRIPLFLMPFYVPLLFTKMFHKTHYIEIIRAKSATVIRKKGKTAHFDGDPVTMGKKLEMKVNPLSLKIIIP